MQTIELHRLAPSKPAVGESCNQCGVCCASEPCPVAYLFLWQRKGRCRALLWQEQNSHYACGMVLQPDCYSYVIPKIARQWMGRVFAFHIAAGKGCDSTIELE